MDPTLIWYKKLLVIIKEKDLEMVLFMPPVSSLPSDYNPGKRMFLEEKENKLKKMSK